VGASPIVAEGTRPDRLPDAAAQRVAVLLQLALVGLALWGLYGLPWLALAPNRLLPGDPVASEAALGSAAHLLATLLIALLAPALLSAPTERWATLRVAALAAVLVALVILTGIAGARLIAGQPPAARALVGSGFWIALGGIALLLLHEARSLPLARVAVIALAGVGALAIARRAGAFEALSLFVEYRARRDAFDGAFWRHLGLSAGALGLAFAVSLPLGWLAFRSGRWRAFADAALSSVQVVPAVALFGLLVSLLSLALGAWPSLRELGFSAIGATPALLGVAAYLALPLTRSIADGLSAADPSAIETAQAMGMSERRITGEVRLPLGLPFFVAGLRVATVQSIGLVTLGGLIGAGGFGALVFEGMSQLAADLIILGSAPVVTLAVVADLTLRGLESRLWRPLS
jgi:osmoprotectant transport system permease protein